MLIPALAYLRMSKKELRTVARARRRIDELKLESLFEHYGLDPAKRDWRALALALADTHVPAFMPPAKKSGPKLRWGPFEKVEVRIAVEQLLAQQPQRHSVTWACSQLARREPWLSLLSKGKKRRNPAEILRQAYYHADRKLYEDVRAVRRKSPERTVIP
jgi:hypothetical protein